MIVKKFESFGKDTLYEPSNDEWYLSHKREGMSDDEYFQLKIYLLKNGFTRVIPQLRPTKHCVVPSSFFQITGESPNRRVIVSKIEDEWYYVQISFLSGYSSYYKCDTIQGVFDLFEIALVYSD